MSSVNVRISVHSNGPLTNNDVVRGIVHLSLRNEATVKAITVKMEGVARTVVPIPANPDHVDDRRSRNRRNKDSKKDAIEVHKVLYQTETVFPPPEVRKSSTQNEFTLQAGEYSYDFEFRVPEKSQCGPTSKSQVGGKGLISGIVYNASAGLDYSRGAANHIVGPLPPSLSGLGELASVKYFFKVTVVRASMFKVNARDLHPFVFLPMDYSPVSANSRVAFVRRDVTIGLEQYAGGGGSASSSSSVGGRKRGGLLGSIQSALAGGNSYGGGGPRGRTMTFAFEVRHSQDFGIVPVAPLPLQFHVVLSTRPDSLPLSRVYLDSLTILLYASTDARAQSYNDQSHLRLDLFTKRGLNIPIELSQATPFQDRWIVPIEGQIASVLAQAQIPDYVPPTFSTCNISRNYSMEIVAGFSGGPSLAVETVSLLLEPTVRSGITGGNNHSAPPPGPPPNFNNGSEKGSYLAPALAPAPHKLTPQEEARLPEKGRPQPPRPQVPSGHAPGPSAGSSGGPSNGKTQEEGELPSYDSVISGQLQQQSGPSHGRRQFGQSKDYFQNMDQDE